MSPPIRVRLKQGRMLPVPPGEGVDGDLVITPEKEIRIRSSAWGRRRISKGDLEVVDERYETAALGPGVPMAPMADPTPTVDIDLDALAGELAELERDLTEE